MSDDDWTLIDNNLGSNGEAEALSGHDDGPWSISVADAPSHNNKKYTIYIQTPAQNLTLIREAQEVADLHAKLRSSHQNTPLPPLPDFPVSGPEAGDGGKRRGGFLNALGRLGQSNSKGSKAKAMSSVGAGTNSQSRNTAPGGELASQTTAALAAYLTTVGNHRKFRRSKAWHRFVRVRAGDLESARTENVGKPIPDGSSVTSRGRASNLARLVRPVSELLSLPKKRGSLRGRGSIKETSSGIVNIVKADGDQASGHLPGSNARTPSPLALPDVAPIPPVAQILASPSTQQAPTTPPPPDTSEPVTLPQPNGVSSQTPTGVSSPTPTASGGQDLPIPDATPTPPPPSPKATTVAEDRLSIGNDALASGSGSKAENNSVGGLGTETKSEGESGSKTDAEKVVREDVPKETKENEEKGASRKVGIDDFEMMRVLGRGVAGKILLVRYRPTSEVYALKVISKRHILAHEEVLHTRTEQSVLKRTARESRDPFVIKLWWSFHDREHLFLVMDFQPGGDLATQLARHGRFGRDRARFYAAEIVEGCEGLHAAGVIYRDLKPENILIGGDGHIVLTDFGLSKEFPRKHDGHSLVTSRDLPTNGPVAPYWMDASGSSGRASANERLPRDTTNTFCGTAEYLAPEVIQGMPYSYEADWWSFGTMLYEMLTGVTPFWAENHSDMYVRVLQDELQFPDDKALDQTTKHFLRGLLQKSPLLRMCEPRIKKHPYFGMIDWQHVYYKRYVPPYVPPVDPANAADTQNFDETFLDMKPAIADEVDETDPEPTRAPPGDKPPTHPNGAEEETADPFDGYSFMGPDSTSDDEEPSKDKQTSDARALDPQDGVGTTTVDESQATPHPTSTDLPETPRAKTSEPPKPESVIPTAPAAEVLAPEPVVEEKPAVATQVKAATPVALSQLDLSELPALPAEEPGELDEPPASPVVAGTIEPALEPASPSTLAPSTPPPKTINEGTQMAAPVVVVNDSEMMRILGRQQDVSHD